MLAADFLHGNLVAVEFTLAATASHLTRIWHVKRTCAS